MEDSNEADIFYSEFQLRGGKSFRTEKDPCALKEIHGWTGFASSSCVAGVLWSWAVLVLGSVAHGQSLHMCINALQLLKGGACRSSNRALPEAPPFPSRGFGALVNTACFKTIQHSRNWTQVLEILFSSPPPVAPRKRSDTRLFIFKAAFLHLSYFQNCTYLISLCAIKSLGLCNVVLHIFLHSLIVA